MKTISKILVIIFLLGCAASFLRSSLITQNNFIILSVLALLVAILAEKFEFGLQTIVAVVIITLEFLQILPSPYHYLFAHNFGLGPALIISFLATAAYVIFPLWLIGLIASRKSKRNLER